MDPTTTLFTFMLQTHPAVKSVQLVGSWDNFSKSHPMERDVRRDRGQWKGTHSFKGIVCDDDTGARQPRNGGLKMAHTYYYYYELDGSHETHNPNLPSTIHCPYLPGQTVNTFSVPVERALRKRSASLNSMRITDWMTMNPADKFTTPRAPPPVPDSPGFRLGSSPMSSEQKSSSRSMSPPPTWRRIFGRKVSTRSNDRGRRGESEDRSTTPDTYMDDARSVASSEGSRTRDISPESLRRFLSDDIPFALPSAGLEERPSVLIPEDIAEENEDDDNFATSAVSEMPFATCLSPPPFKRCHSDSSMPLTVSNASSRTLTKALPAAPASKVSEEVSSLLDFPIIDLHLPRSRFSISSASSVASSLSPRSPDDEMPSFYDSNDDDDVLSSTDGDTFSFQPMSPPSTRKASFEQGGAPIAGYSLPQAPSDGSKSTLDIPTSYASLGSPALIARTDASMSMGNTSLLAAPTDNGLDDLVNEVGWMVDIIRGKGL